MHNSATLLCVRDSFLITSMHPSKAHGGCTSPFRCVKFTSRPASFDVCDAGIALMDEALNANG